MNIRNLRIIFLVFAFLSGIVGWMYHLFSIDFYNVDSDVSIFLISIICFSLFGISFFRIFRRNPIFIAYAFKISIAAWFILVTALNNFPEDYSYSLIFVVLMLSMMYSNTIGFVFFYMSCFLVLLLLAFTAKAPIIELGTFTLLFFATGVLMYFILRSKERTQRELEKAQVNAHAIFQSAVGFFFFLDKDFKIVSFNKFAEEIYQTVMHMELEIGKSIFLYMPPNAHESLHATLCKCMNGEVIKNEKIADFPGGPTVWVENTFVPVYDDNKKFLGISFQTINIDERKKIEGALKESEERFLQLANNIEDAFWIFDGEKYIYLNDSFAKIFGRENEIFYNDPKSIFEFMHPDDRERMKSVINYENYKGRNKVDTQYRIIQPDSSIRWVWVRSFPIYNEKGEVKRSVGILSDITERKNTEAEIERQNVFMQTLIDTIPNPLFYKDVKGRYIGCNKAFEKNISGKKDTLIGKTVYELSEKELADIYFNKDNELFENPGSQVYETKAKFLDGDIHDVIFHKATFLESDGSIGGLVGVILDITERKQFETALKESEHKFRELADNLPLMIYEIDTEGKITYFNKVSYAMTGYTYEDYMNGLDYLAMFPEEEKEKVITNANKIMEGYSLGVIEYTLKRKDGSLFNAIFNTIPIIKDGRIIGRRGVITDITMLKDAEERIKKSLREKEILLSEIHHRVKNNLQVISSMLRLQSSNISDPKILEVFLDAQHRIITMGLVHEKLYKAENFSKINVKEYISDLVESVSSSYNPDPENITIELNVEPVTINLDTMIPLGLILNELLTNSIKYAFPESGSGKISISLIQHKNLKFLLTFTDNGVGIPEPFDLENSQSLGLRLVHTLSEQINGQFSIKNKKGFSFSIEFSEFIRKNEK